MTKEQLESYFKEYYALCYRIAFTQVKAHADAEDIVQEVFVKVLRYHPDFANKDHEKAWMIRTTINLCKDFNKSKWKNTTVGMEKVPEQERAYFHIPFLEEDETLWGVLELPEKYKDCLYLFYYEDYSIKEIAELLEKPENTVKTNLRRGREALKTLLERER